MNDILNWEIIDPILQNELDVDFGDKGDLTTSWTIPPEQKGMVALIAKADGILAGLPVFQRVFEILSFDIHFSFNFHDGDVIHKKQIIGTIEGSIQTILHGERTALNMLQRLSGIATLTRRFVSKIKGTNAKILDTRKTTPGLRYLEKYAVIQGGGHNHRMGLYDMVLIKDNHINVCGGIAKAIEACLSQKEKQKSSVKIEVETRSLNDVKTALKYPVDQIMLDNMKVPTMTQAVGLIQGKVKTEASGNVSLENVRSIAETGVDYISIGALTHSPRVLDMSLLFDM